MSKKFKSQASSSRAAASTFGGFGGFSSSAASRRREVSSLTYVAEPPDLSRISEPQLAIALKNFSKKDEVTRTKALDDLRSYVSDVEKSDGTLDDGFLEAWIRIYPRASIDLHRRVRQSAHLVQGSVACLVGKRIARFLPKVIGAWLAGVYDSDKLVHQSVIESFTRVFSTEEKRTGVWKVYQSSILDFVDDVVLQQTPHTLSDERTVKPEDAEAKYARVVGTAILLLNRILGNTTKEDRQRDLATLENLLGSKSLWTFCYHDDPSVRRSVYLLLRTAVSGEPEELDWKLVSAALIGKSLSITQVGSASDFSECLLHVTSTRPHIWTTDYSGKASPPKKLLQYMRKGSQTGPGTFWSNLYQLLQLIPIQTLAKLDPSSTVDDHVGLSSAAALMDALGEGLSSRDEPQQNRTLGWKIYIEVAMWLAQGLSDNDTVKLLQDKLSPLVVHYVNPDPEKPQWSLPAQSSEAICAEYLTALIAFGYESSFKQLWMKLSDDLLEAVRLSSPEQSKDFKTSQEAVCAQAGRLFSMESSLLSHLADREYETNTLHSLESLNLGLLDNCLQVLRSRNGKPYGAAAVVEEVVVKVPQIAQRSQELLEFIRRDAPELLFSPSGDRIISIILFCRSWPGFGSSFEQVVKQVAQLENVMTNASAVQKLLSSLDFNEVDKEILGPLVMRALELACKGSQLHWSVVISVLRNPSSQGEIEESIFLALLDSLSMEDEASNALRGLTQIVMSIPSAATRFQGGRQGSKLTGKLLFLTESPSDEISDLAESLMGLLKNSAIEGTGSKASLEILQDNLADADEESLSVESLLNIVEELLRSSEPEEVGELARDILPSQQVWEGALRPFLELPPRLSTSITSPLSGVVHLIDRELPETFSQRFENIARDSSQGSAAFRLAHFTVRALTSFDLTEYLGVENFEALFFYLPLAVQLIEDDLDIERYNYIAGSLAHHQREEYREVVNDARRIIRGWSSSTQHISSTGETVPVALASVWKTKLERLDGTSPVDYRVGEAFSKIIDGVNPSIIVHSSEEIGQLCKGVRTDNAIRSAAWIAVLRRSALSSPAGIRVCNELVADSTELKVEDATANSLRKLSLLNLLLCEEEDLNPMTSMPTQRLIFFVKHLIQCLRSEQISLSLKAEIFKALTLALPNMKDMYGPHWEDCLEILSSTWRNISGGDSALAVLNSSYGLFRCLESIIKDEDSNDDVKDSWADRKKILLNDLTSTIWKFDSSTTFYLPQDLTVDRVCRLIRTIPIESLEDVSKAFPLLTARSLALQHTAYTLLHRYIPTVQEQVSFEVALSKSEVKLPYELISLLIGAPRMESISMTYGDDKTWADIRSYLLSWKLVFDHFVNASLAVQEQYASNIKEHDVLVPLLEFMFDFLQKAHGKLVDASKWDIRSFGLDQSESYEKEAQWLLVHLYFLCLKHLANLTKAWWIDAKKRIKGPVEAWTEKFISPLVIGDALERATQWMSTQDPDEERALNVKVASKTAEIIASIAIDEESPPVSISISLPPAYPLHPALVVGRSRVLVDERKWKSWLLTIQGVIMFANGALEDGLLAFRRNVQGAMKGQSECAICYSVISTDMQTPNKRCATCKHTFHSVCLYRWFKSSNQSTCPLCRNQFSFA
ncbi:ubiquitin-protein ligase RKR1 [Aspergillus lucknowensis]|uniref:E3 ubiquitin-protein ligase listerin n=1 Tax=Aspergillus lucknowensis TaxID=176173 RepID=A0ABR4M1B2_9EURO